MLQKMMKRQRGFTLIELLIVVAIIGIIAALLIPNFLDSLQKAKQKRTMADTRNAGTAMMAWLTDEAGAAAAGAAVDLSSYTGGTFTNTFTEVEGTLVPQYLQSLPERDGWKKFFQYALNTGNPLGIVVMGMQSGGRDSTHAKDGWETTVTPSTTGAYDPSSYDNDIVWLDGGFAIWPEKTQPTAGSN